MRDNRRHNLLFTQNSLVKISSSSPKLRKSPRVKISREDSRVAQFAAYRTIWQPLIQATSKAVILPVRKGIPHYQLMARLSHAESTVFEIINGAQIIFKSQNEAIAHDQWSTSWFTRVRLFEKLKFVLFCCASCKGK